MGSRGRRGRRGRRHRRRTRRSGGSVTFRAGRRGGAEGRGGSTRLGSTAALAEGWLGGCPQRSARPPGLSQPSAPRPRAGAPLGSSRGSLLSQLWDSVHPRVAACPSPRPAAGFEALGVREWGFC